MFGGPELPKIVDHDERRQELVQVVLDLAVENGFDSVSVRSVASAAGWTRSVVAHYFRDRDELLIFTYREVLRRTMADVAADRLISNPVDRLIACILRVLPGRGHQSAYHAVFLDLLSRSIHNPAVASAVRAETLVYAGFIKEALAAAVEAGQVAPPLPIDDAALLLTACGDGLGFQVILDPENWNLEDIEDRLRAILSSWAPATA
jgi:AcrR family transcriptional regulator